MAYESLRSLTLLRWQRKGRRTKGIGGLEKPDDAPEKGSTSGEGENRVPGSPFEKNFEENNSYPSYFWFMRSTIIRSCHYQK